MMNSVTVDSYTGSEMGWDPIPERNDLGHLLPPGGVGRGGIYLGS